MHVNREDIHRWREVAADAEVDVAVRAIYAEIEAATIERRPRCDRSGRCCHFEKFGHRMYLTGLETAWFLNQLASRSNSPSLSGRGLGGGSTFTHTGAAHPNPRPPAQRVGGSREETDAGACPFLEDGLCSVHEIRPMGCRIFFCDPTSVDWQNDLYEQMHERIASLHNAHAIPYHYGEWRAMLRMCGEREPELASSAPASLSRGFVHVRIDC